MTIQQPTEVVTAGRRSVSWSTLATVWAFIKSAAGSNEGLRTGAAVTASASYQVEVRYRADVTPKMRLSWTPFLASAAKTLEIQAVTPVGRERLLLDCLEVAA